MTSPNHRSSLKSNIKCTPRIGEALVSYLEDNCLLTLKQLQDMVRYDFGVNISTLLISQKLTCSYLVKQRRPFALQLLDHIAQGVFNVYFNEINLNIYGKRSKVDPPKRAVAVRLPSSKGKNIQIHCAVSTVVGLVCFKTHRGSIKVEKNAAFVDTIYIVVKGHATYKEHFLGKSVVVVLDNTLVHSRMERLVCSRNDLILLRHGPYSPLCNTIEDESILCEVHNAPVDQIQEQRMHLLERGAESSMSCMDVRLVSKMALHRSFQPL
ncbi:Hypothetical protein PHPALM_6548 [Phytophthora palmivora]|uniref:Tc1-like transposase DDE domain-containing protein n=1 Tax=Phytophthora palmivora TaxID=4796 RepID=A0A2P4YEK6_9STRA|nr:Hypothetical protein PHPALM_6548 [Phytophthora palmivora]